MSKTLEELGYEQYEYGKSYDIFSRAIDEEGYCRESITFEKKYKNIKLDMKLLSMEELKAINKKCEELGWLDE
jgi:hypothetical protein